MVNNPPPRNFGSPLNDYGTISLKARIVENGAGTYNADFAIPGGAIIFNLGVFAEVLWTAATSAGMVIGDYTAAAVAIDADGFATTIDLKATALLAGETIEIMSGLASMGGVAGAYLAGTNTHWTNLHALAARILRFTVVSVGAGTAGRTSCWVTYINPITETLVTQ